MPYSIVRRCLKKRRGVGLSAPFFMEKFFMELYILSNTVKHRFGDSFGRGTRLSLVGARGERVAFQAILPKPFHNAFAEADGEWDAEIFWERYVKLSASSSGLTTAGEYPDVMVDASRAEKFKDNTSERGEGVLWCFVTIPADAAGRHTVRLEVTADEGKAAVEAEIEVLDFCLPEQNGNVTSFAIREDMIKSADPGEFRKKYDELVEEHLHYRLSPTKLLPYGTWGIEEALSEARKRTADVRCAAYSLPYKTFREDTIYEKEQECLDTDYLRKLLTAFAENSTDECDLLKKANFYITFIDEPAPERFHSVRRVYREIHDLKREVAKSVDFTGRRGVENSLLTLDNIVTVFNKEPIYGEVDTWCPTYWGYFKPEYVYEEKKLRGLGKKNWWYGCVAPKTPFPNLHTDSPMRDSRFESWLRFLYDISGNLYWATNLTKKYDEKAREYTDCDVLKETLLFPGACGDGLLFYTETKYGAPLPSLRLFSLYLGLQEYEYFMLIERAARKAECFYGRKTDIKKSLCSLFDRIAKGTMLVYDFDAEELRRELGGHVVFAENNIFVESEAAPDANRALVYSPAEAEIFCDGKKGSEIVCGKGKCTVFTFKAGERCIAEISAEIGGKSLCLKKRISPRRIWLPPAEAEARGEKVFCEPFRKELYVRIGSFVNEEAPALFLPVEGDFFEADRIEVFIESFSDDAFILNTVLIDSEGKRYCAGYGVAEENRKSKISVAVCRLTQNRLNSEADALPCEHAEENAAVSARFGFGRLSGIELMLGNNVKLLDDNRERRRSEYSFLIKGVSVTFTT